jgi:NADH-ubiquinone oxidoreductase chain 2
MIFSSILILIVAIALPSINNNISSNIYIRISTIILLFSGLLALSAINIPLLDSGIGLFSGLFHVRLISQIMDLFIFLISSLILVSWPLINNKLYKKKININSLKNKINKLNTCAIEFSLLILFNTLGASFLISSADIVSMYLSIELQSFSLYILTTIFKDSDSATAAGLKYFLLGAQCTRETLLKSPIKLSNSGESLKLMVPSYIWKIISGWTNYSCTVISYKIIERATGNRGSKSVFNNTVKEQRVNGSWWTKPFHLKYTLMGCENNYQINNLSKQLILSKKIFLHLIINLI